MKKPLVYIIVLNWNHKDDLALTLDSFSKQNYENKKIVISDNGSSDGSQELVKSHYQECKLIENKENLGWAAGNNVGIKYALSNKADYILLANNDLYFDDDNVISTLVGDLIELEKDNIGILGTNVNYFEPRDKLHNSGWIMFPKSISKGKIFNQYRELYTRNIEKKYHVVDFVSGCFMLIDKTVFNQVGLIDEAFFIYGEETEFSLRAWQKGIGSAINKEITIYHKIAATNKIGSPFSMYLKTRNLYYILRKHKAIIPDFKFFRRKYFYDFFKNLIKINIIPNNYNGNSIVVLASTIRGMMDGVFFKRKGKDGIKF